MNEDELMESRSGDKNLVEQKPIAGKGWIGSQHALMAALIQVKCDQDETGAFHVDGSIVSFMGLGEEFVVGENAVYYRDGVAYPLVPALPEERNEGLKCMVIG